MSLVSELFMGIYPVQLFSNLVSVLSNIVNGLIVGNLLSPGSMVALGFVSPFNAIIAALSAVLAGGSRVLCGRFLGKGDIKSIDITFTYCIKAVTGFGIVLTVLCFVLATPIAGLLGAKGESIQYTTEYLRGISLGIVFAMVLPCMLSFLQMSNDTKFSLILVGILVAVNALLAFVFLKVFQMGIFGVGLATSISQFVAVIAAMLRYKRKKGLVKLSRGEKGNTILKDMIVIGIPSAIATILYPARNILLNSFAMSIAGDNAVGALAILGSCGGFFDAFNTAMATTVLMMASLAVGEKDSDFVRKIAKYCLKVGVIIGLAQIAFLFFLGAPIAQLFGATGERVELAKDLLFKYSLTKPLNMIAVTIVNTYLALGKIKEVNILNVFTAFVFPIGFVLIFKGILGIDAVWYCYVAAEILTMLSFLVYYLIEKKGFPKTFYDILMVDGIEPPNGHLKFTLSTLDEISVISNKTCEFCSQKGIDSRRTMLSGLCLEEMTRNTIETNFPKDKRKKKHSIEVFVMSENDEVFMRIRDNGQSYNLDEIETIFNPEDPFENIGVRVASKICKEMNYLNPFGMNVLNLRL